MKIDLGKLEPGDSEAETEWKIEVERRLSEMDSGEARPIDWESLRAKLSRKLDVETFD